MKLFNLAMLLKPLSLLIKTKRLLFGSLVLVIFITSYWLWLDYNHFSKQPIEFSDAQRLLIIDPGTGINHLAMRMEKQKLIKHSIYLKLFAHFSPEFKNLKTGEYLLDRYMTPKQVLTKLSQGQVIQYSFTIIEGQTYYQVLDNLAIESRLVSSNLSDLSALLANLEINHSKLEGWFYPETYYFSQGETAISILKRAVTTMKEALQQEWQQRATNLPYDTAYDALIMASIIEKETGIASERSEIAGVFVRRLQKKMRLQTDPTVIYGIGPEFNGDITRRDLKTPTAYNTYVIKGLPPTPIAMPSRESIHAALHPAEGKSLYFVADGSGGHYFSETLAEHQLAVNRMLKREKKP